MHSYYVCIHTHIGILAIKKKGVLPWATTWMDLENTIMLSEISQTETDKYSTPALMCVC